ncbi:MAG: sigma-70 family RNA polymerase sigma factor [Bryobacterales bacterium]|nr:sigma-70 family RNA polymerase sigma factor [Bryobacterales bacterium]
MSLDPSQFESLFRAHQADVYGWIARIVRDRGAAEDLTVETFWRVWRHRERYDASRPFLPWVRRIASRVAIDHLRHAPRLVGLERTPEARDAANPEGQSLQAQLENAIRSLPAKFQAVAVLSLVEEKAPGEIAEAFEIPLATVKTRRARAIQMLRRKLEAMGVRP